MCARLASNSPVSLLSLLASLLLVLPMSLFPGAAVTVGSVVGTLLLALVDWYWD